MSYEINYDDKRFTEVDSQKDAALKDVNKTYDSMISQSDKFYQDQIQASKDWADKQTEIQNQQTDFTIEKVEQQKEQAKKDYTKEQSGAYVDWQKQSNQYGANAEQKAASGLTNTGYTESSQVMMYNTYQNRVATAREAYNRAVLNYDNAIKEARLQNNAALAEIAYKALQEQLELSLQGFQYKNQLVIDKANKKTEVERDYYNRYQDVLKQINTENAMAEEIRQYNESLALQKEQLAEEKRQFNEQMAYQKSRSSGGGSSGGSGGSSGSKKSSGSSKINKGSSNGSSINKSSGKKDNAKTMDSIIKLGYGPISPKTLDEKVSSGEVKEIKAGNTTVFAKNPNAKPANRKELLFKNMTKNW